MAARAASSSILTEQDSPSPRSVDEEEEPVDQDPHASANREPVSRSPLSRLERLPTEILSAIISFDYLTWPALDVWARVGPWRSTFAWRGYDDEEEDDEYEDRAPIHAYEQLAEDLLCEESLGEDEADYLPDILNAFPNVRSLRLEGCEYFSTADSVEYLVECLPNLREVMTIATRAERGRGPEDGKDSSDQSAEEELGQALEEEGIRFIPLKY